jgi:hypothetical protein
MAAHLSAVGWRGTIGFVSIARGVRAVGIGVLAGLPAGLLAGGIGGRGAMKIVALTAGAAAQGHITENGNRIGAFTIETIFLLFFGSTLGMIGGMLYMALRPWLPRRAPWRGLAFGVALLATVGTATIDAHNFDFARFGLPVLNVVLFAALFLIFGLLVAPLAERIDQFSPHVPPLKPPRPRAFAAYAALGLSGLLGIAMLTLAFFSVVFGQGEDRSIIALIVALLTGALTGRVAASITPRGREFSMVLPSIPVLIGALLTLRSIVAILLP